MIHKTVDPSRQPLAWKSSSRASKAEKQEERRRSLAVSATSHMVLAVKPPVRDGKSIR